MSLTLIDWSTPQGVLQTLTTTPLTTDQFATLAGEQIIISPEGAYSPDPWGAQQILDDLASAGARYDAEVADIETALVQNTLTTEQAQAAVSATANATNIDATALTTADLLARIIAMANVLAAVPLPWSSANAKPAGLVVGWPWLSS